jgi:hypothetical protein
MRPRKVIESIINTSVAIAARAAGFKKSRMNFFRRKGTVVQVINIQLSQWNYGDKGDFYVNIALAFDELRAHETVQIIETPKEYECDFRKRLEYLVPGTPYKWEVFPQADSESIAQSLFQSISVVISLLNEIDSLSSFLKVALAEEWFALPGEYNLLARLHDTLGNAEDGEKYRQLYTEFLHNRAAMPRN